MVFDHIQKKGTEIGLTQLKIVIVISFCQKDYLLSKSSSHPLASSSPWLGLSPRAGETVIYHRPDSPKTDDSLWRNHPLIILGTRILMMKRTTHMYAVDWFIMIEVRLIENIKSLAVWKSVSFSVFSAIVPSRSLTTRVSKNVLFLTTILFIVFFICLTNIILFLFLYIFH